jgi:hypothetical protein
MKISISKIKSIREELEATHIVIFTIDENNNYQVATHGKTFLQAKEAAKAGNNLKTALGWPENICKSQPLIRKCKNCFYWKADYGIHCFNGWSDNGDYGYCSYEIQQQKTSKDNICHHFEPGI